MTRTIIQLRQFNLDVNQYIGHCYNHKSARKIRLFYPYLCDNDNYVQVALRRYDLHNKHDISNIITCDMFLLNSSFQNRLLSSDHVDNQIKSLFNKLKSNNGLIDIISAASLLSFGKITYCIEENKPHGYITANTHFGEPIVAIITPTFIVNCHLENDYLYISIPHDKNDNIVISKIPICDISSFKIIEQQINNALNEYTNN